MTDDQEKIPENKESNPHLSKLARMAMKHKPYETPSPEEFKAYLKFRGLSLAKAADFAGVEVRTVQRWTAPSNQNGARKMPWAAWMMIRLLDGKLSIEPLFELD
jgi:hypothetical protein